MNSTTFVGNLTKDPIIKTSAAGKNRALLTVAVNEQVRKADGSYEDKANFINVTVFNTEKTKLADNVASSLKSGNRVIVSGRFDNYKKPVVIDGKDVELEMVSFIASAIGPDLLFATADVRRTTSNGGGAAAAAPAQAAPAAAPAAAATEDF